LSGMYGMDRQSREKILNSVRLFAIDGETLRKLRIYLNIGAVATNSFAQRISLLHSFLDSWLELVQAQTAVKKRLLVRTRDEYTYLLVVAWERETCHLD
jgi:hypothetical protein